MAVFLMNICRFGNCGLIFRTLGDLIQHIEDTHIDFDPRVLEKQELLQPPCIPLSYVLRVFTDETKKENLEYYKKQKRAQSPAVSICSTTPSGSEFDEEELVSASDDSNDSWTTQEEFSSEFILRYGGRTGGNTTPNEEKPFACPVPGCKKRYKNINGIKYHAKNGHRKDARVKKPFRCHCGKSYKTTKGLRSHSQSHHGGACVPAAIAESITGEQLLPVVAHSGGQRNAASTCPYAASVSGSFPQSTVTAPPELPSQSSTCSGHCSQPTVAVTNADAIIPNSSLPLAMLLSTPPPTPTSAQATHTCTSAPTYSRSAPHCPQQLIVSSNGSSPPLSCCTAQHGHQKQHQQSHGFPMHRSYSPLNLYPPFVAPSTEAPRNPPHRSGDCAPLPQPAVAAAEGEWPLL